MIIHWSDLIFHLISHYWIFHCRLCPHLHFSHDLISHLRFVHNPHLHPDFSSSSWLWSWDWIRSSVAFFFFSSGFGSRFIFIFYSTWSLSLAIYSSIYINIFKRLDSTGTCWLSSSMMMIINDFDYIFGNGFFTSQSQLIMLMPGNIPIHKNIRNSHFMMFIEYYDHHTLNFLNCCCFVMFWFTL